MRVDGKDQGAFVAPDVQQQVSADFRLAMRRHAAGVCVVSVGEGESVNGMTITAATSFSMSPPSILICVNETASVAPLLALGAGFGLTVLGRHQDGIAAAFARRPSGRSRFEHGAWRLGAGRPPRLEDAAANLACTVVEVVAYGSHVAIIGRVDDVHLGAECPSLVYRDGQYDVDRAAVAPA
jgi:flavin reductase